MTKVPPPSEERAYLRELPVLFDQRMLVRVMDDVDEA